MTHPTDEELNALVKPPCNHINRDAQGVCWDCGYDARAQLAASQPADPVTNAGCCQPVRVKPLEWVDVGADCLNADVYSIGPTYGQGPERFMLTRGTKIIRWGDQPEPLKAAAQADHEARIRASIEAAPRVNKTPKSEHDRADVLTAIEPAPVTLADALHVPEVQALIEAAKDRDGGAHDPDCRILNPARNQPHCSCGHVALKAALRAIEKGKI